MSRHRLAGLPSGRRTKFAVMALWLIIAAVVAPLALKLTEVQNNDALGALPKSVEASRAAARAEVAFPESDALVAVAVYARDTGLTDADRAKVAGDRTAFARYAEDGRLAETMPSDDGAAMLVSFVLAGTDEEQSAAVTEIVARLAADAPDGLRTALTGSAGADHDIFDAFEGMDTALLLVTLGTVALLLLITYRSPVLWVIPIFCVVVANQVASAAVYLLARYGGLTVDFQSQSILTVLVFGVGVDYALLLISRYREELRRHADRHDAMIVALRRSAGAIAASAATVAVGLLCLLAAQLPSTRGLGPVGAVGIIAALVVMTTLLPAILVLCGRWLFWPFAPRFSADAAGQDIAGQHRVWRAIAAGVSRRPRAIWIGTAAALAALTFGIGNLSIGMPGDESFTKEVGSVTGQRLIEAHYPAGAIAPATIVASAGTADAVVRAARAVDGIADVGAPERSADGRWVRVRAIVDATPDSDPARDTVERLRDAVHAVPGGQALVGGETAMLIDEERTVRRDNLVVIPLILVGRPLVLPNAWDFASAAALVRAGFTAIGTTSLGVAAAHGLPDGRGVARAETVRLARLLGRLPCLLTIDLEGGFSDDPAEVAELAAELPAAGINIEDGRADGTLVPVDRQCETIAAIKARAPGLFVNARTDTYWLRSGTGSGTGSEAGSEAGSDAVAGGVDETLERIAAYVAAGADGVFVPGVADAAEIRALVAGAGVPLNVLLLPGRHTVGELAGLGVRRVSCGSLLFRAAIHAAVGTALAVARDEAVAAGIPGYAEIQHLADPR